MAFKDIAFAFVAPLVILNSAISAISSAIAKAKQDTQDILDFAAKGESKYADKGAGEMARAATGIKQRDKEMAMGKEARKEAAQAYLDAGKEQGVFGDSEGNLALKQYLDEGEGKGALEMTRRRIKHAAMFTGVTSVAGDEEMQDVLSRRAAMFNKGQAEPANAAAAAAAAQTAAQKASDDAAKAKGTTFKGPEGFSNVVGVGANPVIEAMTMQLEETRKQTALLEILANPGGGGVPIDFTKVEQTTMTT
jgi:hypothetical protein